MGNSRFIHGTIPMSVATDMASGIIQICRSCFPPNKTTKKRKEKEHARQETETKPGTYTRRLLLFFSCSKPSWWFFLFGFFGPQHA